MSLELSKHESAKTGIQEFHVNMALEERDEYVPISFDEESEWNEDQETQQKSSLLRLIPFGIMSIFLIQIIGVAFIQIGIPLWLAFLIIPGSFIGSLVNIPLYTTKQESTSIIEIVSEDHFGYSMQMFQPNSMQQTKISINLGGAIIPMAVSAYLMLLYSQFLLPIVIATTTVTLVVHRVAKIVPNLGITTPGLLPPLAAVFATIAVGVLFPGIVNLYAIAYIAGTLGALIGADFLNLGKLSQLKTDSASIGGAGTSDGVFLTGLIAVILL